jgi:glycosyltransferase involved in cell wall biosynthesis
VRLVHLTASTFFGGPERQMLGLARALPEHVRTSFICFQEGGRHAAFLNEIRTQGFPAYALTSDFPRIVTAVRELVSLLREKACDVLLCHGYKAHILGRLAARSIGLPAIAVSRGWTGESRRVKVYEWLDRRHLRFMDHVVCVSEGQAAKVRQWCRVPSSRLTVIRNSSRLSAFEKHDSEARKRLLAFFPHDSGITNIVLGAGRLSPEKGFGVLVEAAATICRDNPNTGIVLFGEGVLRSELEQRIAELGLQCRFLMPGFRTDLDALIGAADVVVLPSHTEGLPNVALEASAAGVPVVATAVGGTPEAVANGESGFLVPPGEPEPIASRVGELLRNEELRKRFGGAGRERMRVRFTFEAQAIEYLRLFDSVAGRRQQALTPNPLSPGKKGRTLTPPLPRGEGVG